MDVNDPLLLQGYDPEKVWLKLKADGHYRKGAVIPLLTFPFDRRTEGFLTRATLEAPQNVAFMRRVSICPQHSRSSRRGCRD
jgi:hypothetical protein